MHSYNLAVITYVSKTINLFPGGFPGCFIFSSSNACLGNSFSSSCLDITDQITVLNNQGLDRLRNINMLTNFLIC